MAIEMLTLSLLLGPPLLASCLSILVRRHTHLVGWAGVAGLSLSFAASIALCVEVVTGGSATAGHPLPDLWHVDALSALVALCIAFVALLASASGPGLGGDDGYDEAQTRRFRIFMNAFALDRKSTRLNSSHA